VCPTLTPSLTNTATQTQTPSPTGTFLPTPTQTQTQTNTPSPTFCFNPQGYMLFDAFSNRLTMNGWMASQGSTFRGMFLNSPSTNPTIFEAQMNAYIDYSGYTSTGFNLSPTPITILNEDPFELNSTVTWSDQFVWTNVLMPTCPTCPEGEYRLVGTVDPPPHSINPLYRSFEFYYSGTTIPQGYYRLYTTFSFTDMRLSLSSGSYFLGDLVCLPTPTPTVTSTQTQTPTPTSTPTGTPPVTPSNTPSNTSTQTPTGTPPVTPSNTPSNTATQTGTPPTTPTQTSTPSSTPPLDDCICYQYTNDGDPEAVNAISYLDCSGDFQQIDNIPFGTSGYFCAIFGSVQETEGLTYIEVDPSFCGGCGEPPLTPTQTQTQTGTPPTTPTPSPTGDVTCIQIIDTVINPDPQTGANNYFGVNISLSPFPVTENVTVTGYIRDDGDITNTYDFSITIPGGSQSGETANNVLTTGPADTATIFVTGVTPTTVTYNGNSVYFCGFEPIEVLNVFGYMEPCIGGTIDDYMGAAVFLGGNVTVDTEIYVEVSYVFPGNTCGGFNNTQNFTLEVLSGENQSNFNACNNGAYFSSGAVICSACVTGSNNPNIDFTSVSC
jgi:hypothetical protein